MRRAILILDVTAMSGENVCVAGIEIDSKQTIRLSQPQPTRAALKAIGRLNPGEVIAVDVEPVPSATPPHVEDHAWNPRSLEKLRRLDNPEICKVIRPTAFDSINAAFGDPSSRNYRWNNGWAPRSGARSLATILAHYARFECDDRGAIRVSLRDHADEYWRWIPFQDLIIREHREGNACCEDDTLANVEADFRANACLIRVGLTRPFSPDEHEDNSACWLQVTNILARDRAHFL